MKLTFLGTGTSQGIPIIGCKCEVCQSNNPKDKRLRCSVIFTIGDQNILIDIGPDFRQQMLNNNFDDLDAILLTHQHNDHIIGLDDVRPFNFKQGIDIPVYSTECVQKDLKNRFSYIFEEDPYPGAPRLQLNTINKEEAFYIDEIKIQPIEVMHGLMPVLGFRINKLTYITDAKTIAPIELEKIKGTEVLIINSLHHREHHSHLNLEGALAIIEQIKPKRAYLTHMSHRMGLASDIEPSLPAGVKLAYDGLALNIS